MIKRFLVVLDRLEQDLKLDLTSEDIADIIWLSRYIQPQKREQTLEKLAENLTGDRLPPPQSEALQKTLPLEQTTLSVDVYTHTPKNAAAESSVDSGSIVFKAPSAPALREPLKLAKALRPFIRRVSSNTETVIDEAATAQRIAELGIIIPVMKPTLDSWLDLAIVVEESPTMAIWRQTLIALQRLLEHHGAFRDVRTWSMFVNDKKQVRLRSGIGSKAGSKPTHQPKELVDPNGRRLILVVSDCVSTTWRDTIIDVLTPWVQTGPVAIVQMLPEYLWDRSALGLAASVKFRSLAPGTPNQKLIVEDLASWEDINVDGIKVPVITLAPEPFATWANMVVGAGDTKAVGFVFDRFNSNNDESSTVADQSPTESIPPEQRVYRFLNTASPIARKLAGLLAAAPVISLPVVQMIQEQMLKQSRQVHVAEVFLGGLLKINKESQIYIDTDPDSVQYDFLDDRIRSILQDTVSLSSSVDILNQVSDFVEKHTGLAVKNFMARLLDPTLPTNEPISDQLRPFAKVTAQLLKRLGGQAAEIAQRLEQQILEQSTGIRHHPETRFLEETGFLPPLQPFEFDVATVEVRSSKVSITRNSHEAQYFTENLPNNVTLEMVSIPGGTFIMGAPETEEESRDNERPQHQVTVPPFFMGKYTVTQAQWRVVAALPQVNRLLDPDPSRFKGDNLPVETIYWYDAVEFCDRLSVHTKHHYRLPSEAEWEYACRAGTTTPFHFGETITPELANYYGNSTYGSGSKGEYREKTTPVGSFNVANAFGLYDLHGNVWEWCADDWHDNYEGAPDDGSAWLISNNENDNHLLRGGSWYNFAFECRCAFRSRSVRDVRNDHVGFRVALPALS